MQFFLCPLQSYLRTRRFSEVTFRPRRHTKHWKTQHFATSLTFRACWSSFFPHLLIFFLAALLFQLSILSEVRLLNFLRLILPSMAEFQSPHKSNLCSTWWLVILDGFLPFKTFKEYLQMMMSPHHPHPSTSTSSRCFLAWQIRMRSPQGAGEKWKKTWSKDVSADVAYRGLTAVNFCRSMSSNCSDAG